VGGIIPSNFFMDSEMCGDCQRNLRQWKAHHHFASSTTSSTASRLNIFRASGDKLPSGRRLSRSRDVLQWRFDSGVGTDRHSGGARAWRVRRAMHYACGGFDGMAGSLSRIALHELASSKNKYLRAFEHFLTYLNPEPHRQTFMKPFYAEGHGVLFGVPQGSPGCAVKSISVVPGFTTR